MRARTHGWLTPVSLSIAVAGYRPGDAQPAQVGALLAGRDDDLEGYGVRGLGYGVRGLATSQRWPYW